MPVTFSSTYTGFCSCCASILPTPLIAPSDITCKVCGQTSSIKEKNNELVCRLEKVYEKRVMEDLEDDGGAESIVDHTCPKCAHTKATYSTMQTRSADEGQTVFYTCLNCKNKTIEYS
ncbi:hypothetical protein PFISCL1PPCAC_19775 [Pristionchus fissidentatus]|uniref:DNA-directed RNA polymerase subunit n=1 Tax=Pristionchus fissidentatus TaxID=1538716 RepID=A0AAV5WCQ6_9BILA|nr:hypothetical protein PFISCL1PPCAC_19775 [Pristionchus fissidentatus]